jgi:dTDP-4-dehydrorhamnose 3,5-epimerase
MDSLKWGVEITPLRSIQTDQGSVLHGIKKSDMTFQGFGEAYFSTIFSGSLKGWKRHREMTLNLIVPVGSIRFVIFESHDFGIINSAIDVVLGRENYSRITIPPGLWVAFQGLGETENILLNVSTHEHDPLESDTIEIAKIDYNW